MKPDPVASDDARLALARQRARRTGLIVGLVAFAVFAGFIAMNVMGHRGH